MQSPEQVTDVVRDADNHVEQPAEQPAEAPSLKERTLELLRQTDKQRLRDRLPKHFSD